MQKYEQGEGTASGSVKAALGRIVRVCKASAAQAPAAAPQTAPGEGAKDLIAARLLAEGADPSTVENTSRRKQVNIRQLIDAANYGEPCPKALPSDDDLKRIGAAADLGYALPVNVCGFPDSKTSCGEYLFPDLVLALGRAAHGGLLQWRQDPATALNTITAVARIAADRGLGSVDLAARVATEYDRRVRDELHSWSRANPEKEGEHWQFLHMVAQRCLVRDPVLYSEAERAFKSQSDSAAPGRSPDLAAADSSAPPACMAHAMSGCGNKKCKFSHACAFCHGSKPGCPHLSGRWLDWHLKELRQPKIIVNRDGGRGKGGGRQKSRSRSPRAGRERSPSGAGDAAGCCGLASDGPASAGARKPRRG